MNNIKDLFIKRFKIVSILSLCITFSIKLLTIRIKLADSFFYLFLVWNLFLAVIPYTITTYLVNLPRVNKLWLVFWFGVWLLFLPNAPYIITDLIHLRISEIKLIWLDILIVIAFAFTGLLLFYFSFLDMMTTLRHYLKRKVVSFLIPPLLVLSAFGVYLGRFLRYNSWEILSNPKYLFEDIFSIVA
ncbi:MAG: DUF1361 domain-containing protein [Jejuia sp.]